MTRSEQLAREATESRFQATRSDWPVYSDYYQEGYLAGFAAAREMIAREMDRTASNTLDFDHWDRRAAGRCALIARHVGTEPAESKGAT